MWSIVASNPGLGANPGHTWVQTETMLVWPTTDGFLKVSNSVAEYLLGRMNFMAQLVSELSHWPSGAMTFWPVDSSPLPPGPCLLHQGNAVLQR